MAKYPAIFLDRDGTIIDDNGFIKDVCDIQFYPFSFEALSLLQEDFLLFILTNQSGVAKGVISEEEVSLIHNYIRNVLKKEKIAIYDIFCCPHKNEDNCECKKPKTWFIYQARQKYNLDLNQSYIIGDHLSDVQCGLNAGITPLYILTGHGEKHLAEIPKGTIICKNLLEAAKYITSKND